MRSSKSRSRSKANRPRTLGNIINRVFDSSGPEGKVRGTPQQIIEKYQMLARDAQLSNDRVAAENFSQHAEHYTRMLAEAMREMAAEQEARQQQFQQGGGQNSNAAGGNGGQGGYGQGSQGHGSQGQGGQSHGAQGQGGQGQPRGDRQEYRDRDRDRDRERGERPERQEYRPEARDLGSEEQPAVVEVIDLGSSDDTGLIETPEARSRSRGPSAKVTQPAPAPEAPAGTAEPETTPREDRPQGARRARGPRKPKPDAGTDGNGSPPKEAAE